MIRRGFQRLKLALSAGSRRSYVSIAAVYVSVWWVGGLKGVRRKHCLSAVHTAISLGTVPLNKLDYIVKPVSDPKALTNMAVFESFASPFITGYLTVGHTKVTTSNYRDFLFHIGISAMKRLGLMEEVQAACQAILDGDQSSLRQKSLAHNTMGDINHLLLRWKDALDREVDITQVGESSFFVRPNDSFFTHERLQSNLGKATAQHYQEALKVDPDYSFTLYNQARLQRDLGDLEQAKELFEAYSKAIEISPEERGACTGCDELLLAGLLNKEIPENLIKCVITPVFGDDPYLSEPPWKLIKVDIVDNNFLAKHLGKERCTVYSGEESIYSYWIYADNKPAREVKRTCEATDVLSMKPDRLDIVTTFMPQILIDQKYLPKFSRIYSGLQFNLFDAFILSNSNNQALVLQSIFSRELSDIVVCQGYADNYFHFLFDCIGSLAFVAEEELDGKSLVFGGGNGQFARYQIEILNIFGLDKHPLIKLSNGMGRVRAENALITTNPNFRNMANPRVVKFLRERLMSSARHNPTPGNRIFLYRANRRRIPGKSFQGFISYLEKHGFNIVDPEAMTVEQQRDLLKDAEVLVMEIGAAAANMLLCPTGCQVVLLSCEFGYKDIFAPISSTLGLGLHIVLSANREIYPTPYLAWSEVWLSLSLEDSINAVEQAIAQTASSSFNAAECVLSAPG